MSLKMKSSNVEWIGDIPENWDLRKIKYILSERNEKNDPLKSKKILSLSVSQGVIPYSEKKGGGNKSKGDLTKYKLAYPNDIVMNSMNILSGSVSLSKYFGCVSPVYYMFFSNNDNVNIKYYNYIFQTKMFQNSLIGLGNGILIKESSNGKLNTIRMRISSDKIKNLLMPFPNIKTQTKIVEYLDFKVSEINKVILKTKKTIKKYEEFKQSLISEVITTGLNNNCIMKKTNIEWIGKIPKDWNIIKAKFLFSQRNQKGNNIKLQLLSSTQKFGVIPQELYEELSIMSAVKVKEDADLSSFKCIHEHDYCISLRSFEGGFEYCEYEGVVSPAYSVFYPKINIDYDYYKYLFKEYGFIKNMRSYCMSLRDGKNISFEDFGNTYIPHPPLQIQHEIAEYLDKKCKSIDVLILEKEKLINKLESYKHSLIYEYVTGKKEVHYEV